MSIEQLEKLWQEQENKILNRLKENLMSTLTKNNYTKQEIIKILSSQNIVHLFGDISQKIYHLEDIVLELENILDIDVINSINLDKLLYQYEDDLGDSEDWHYILNNTINRYIEELVCQKN